MTIARAFAKYMEEELSLCTFAQDLFIGGIPKDKKHEAIDRAWWIVSSGGTPITKNNTGEKQKNYVLYVYFRNTDAQDVDEAMQAFEIAINGKNCAQLESFNTVEMEATGFQSDQDIDNEERTVGLVEVTVTVYQSA